MSLLDRTLLAIVIVCNCCSMAFTAHQRPVSAQRFAWVGLVALFVLAFTQP